jgi:hypothetical protein
MDDPENRPASEPEGENVPSLSVESVSSSEFSPLTYGTATEAGQGRRLRHLGTLFLTALVAFGLTTIVMVRVEDPAALFGFGPGPPAVVRTQLQALNRGDLREAYAQFSDTYRGTHSFNNFHDLVVAHWNIFRTSRVSFRELAGSGNRVLLEAQMRSADGREYVARFSLVRESRRWWIDDIRWGPARGHGNLIRT